MEHKKLNFCPYEPDFNKNDGSFRKIDMENPAYEMKFYFKRSYEELKNKTVLGSHLDDIVKAGPDPRLRNMYNDEADHYMLWESIGGKPGDLKRLLEAIDEGNENFESAPSMDIYGKGDAQKLEYQKNPNGTYTISYGIGSDMAAVPIVDIVPCCPICHRPLPLGWHDAEDFMALSLMAYMSGGKTTYLLSMMAENWACFNNMDTGSVSLEVTSAHNAEHEKWYEELENAAEKLVDEGYCPKPTDPSAERIPPIFLAVEYNGHKMILGLYDNSGETFQNMASGDPRVIMLSCMDAHLFLIDPAEMSVPIQKKHRREGSSTKEYRLMNIAQQAEFQVKHQAEMVSGQSLLDAEDKKLKRKKQDWHEMFTNMKKAYKLAGVDKQMNKQHLSCVVVKSDLLEDLPEFYSVMHKKSLFNRKDINLNKDEMFVQQDEIEEIIFDKYVFRDHLQKRKLSDAFNSVSWHCISALGCDAEAVESGLFQFEVEDYSPIRLAEPVAARILERVVENNWDD